MTVIELKNWLKDKADNRRLINVAAGKFLEYSDLGLSVPDRDDGTEPELFDE